MTSDPEVEAWAFHWAARDNYHKRLRELRDAGLSKRKAQERVGEERARLDESWLRLHELGQVELSPYKKRGMTVKRARNIVARQVIASAADDALGNQWENYPDIGEHDWEAIEARMTNLAGFPDPESLAAAYQFLAARAEHPDRAVGK